MTYLPFLLIAARGGRRVGDAARMIGISRTTLYRYEKGIGAPPSLPVRRSIFAAYGVPDPDDVAPATDADSAGAA